ncbi:MAG TPA: hypothetical protein VGL95_11005 [Acetobacteraceae bacterium]|jgi:hypothetical protein
MSAYLTVYLFRDSHFAPSGDTVVCAGAKAGIESYLGGGQVESLFKGFAVYTDRGANRDYIGVWGIRNASGLRRLLKERGAALTVHKVPPPNARLRYFKTLKKFTIVPYRE